MTGRGDRAVTGTRPRTPEDTTRVCDLLAALKPHLVHTREVLDGVDFLFAGPEQEILAALRSLSAMEHELTPRPRVDYARLEGIILLRVYGSSDLAEICKSCLL
jgi:hypothetical protein